MEGVVVAEALGGDGDAILEVDGEPLGPEMMHLAPCEAAQPQHIVAV